MYFKHSVNSSNLSMAHLGFRHTRHARKKLQHFVRWLNFAFYFVIMHHKNTLRGTYLKIKKREKRMLKSHKKKVKKNVFLWKIREFLYHHVYPNISRILIALRP